MLDALLGFAAGVSTDDLAGRTDGFSGADVQAVCKQAALAALREAVAAMGETENPEDLEVRIAPAHLDRALETVQASRDA